MKYYISKNDEQLGLFETMAVTEMLKNGDLSPNDFALKEGEHSWVALKELFPNDYKNEFLNEVTKDFPNDSKNQFFNEKTKDFPIDPENQFLKRTTRNFPIDSENQFLNEVTKDFPTSNETNKTLPKPTSPITTARSKSWLPLLLIGLFIFTVVSYACYFLVLPIFVPPNYKSVDLPQGSGTSVSNFKDLVLKAEEFAKLTPTLQIETNPIIKGKVAVVQKNNGRAELIGFNFDGSDYSNSPVEDYGFSNIRLATKPIEIETLVQIICSKGAQVASFSKGIKGFANPCQVSIIDYKKSVTIARKLFPNNTPPESLSRVDEGSSEFILRIPDELVEYLNYFPIDKFPNLSAISFNNKNGEYGKYKSLQDLSPELVRTPFSINLNPNAIIKGKIAVVKKVAGRQAKLVGIDFYGKEINESEAKILGINPFQLAEKVEEIDTLIQVYCKKGTRIGAVKSTVVYSQQCQISLVDYKTSTIFFQQTIENKVMDRKIDTEVYPTQYIVIEPMIEIEEFIKGYAKE